jgi:hypothetical protein
MHERPQQREGGDARGRIRIQHLARGKVFACLRPERREISVQPTARHQQRNAPRQAAGDEHHARADQRSGNAAPDSIEQHQHQQRQREPHRLRSQADAECGKERADHDHAARSGRQCRRQATIAVVRRALLPPRRHQAGLRGERRRETGQIAHRPGAEIPEQRTRCGDRRGRERLDVETAAIACFCCPIPPECREHSIQQHDREHARQHRQHRQ